MRVDLEWRAREAGLALPREKEPLKPSGRGLRLGRSD
jgi:hypothetical protein